MSKPQYFAAKPSTEAASIILSKADKWFNTLELNGYLEKLKEMWMAYYGAYYSNVNSGHKITFSGEQGEIANLPINHIHNLAKHIKNMITATRPAMQARATNTDSKSLIQTKLANNLLDYYLREKRLEDYFEKAAESAIILGTGFIKMEWNATTGEIVDYNEELNTPIYEGDVEFKNLSPFDVAFDSSKEDNQHDWVICRSFKNRWDLVAKYPEYEAQILQIQTKDKIHDYTFSMGSAFSDETDDIPIYEFYHRRSEALPDGRYMLMLDSEVVLIDTPMPYRKLPIYRISAGDIMGTPYGYSDLFDVLPIQDAINSLYSTILTNQNAFGVQNVLVPRGSDINEENLGGALNVLSYNAQFGKPEALNLTQTPAEIFNFVEKLERTAETLSGVNSVARGNPESSLKSGNALALVQSMALQYMSGLQQSYVKMVEDVGTGLILMLRDFAASPRIAMISGIENRTIIQKFTGDDLNLVNRVIVDIGNPLSKTTAGRVQMAEQMLQMGLIKTPEQYFSVMNYGKIETMTDGIDKQLLLIRDENEKMISGGQVQAILTDQHSLHIKEHRDVLSDVELRRDPKLVELVLNHIQEHIDLLKSSDPATLNMLGEQSLMPPPPPPGSPQPNQQPDQNGQVQETLQPEPSAMQDPVAAMNMNLPQPATPPAPFDNLPTNPQESIPQ